MVIDLRSTGLGKVQQSAAAIQAIQPTIGIPEAAVFVPLAAHRIAGTGLDRVPEG